MDLPSHKTKIVCTIGPSSDSREIIEEMITAGMNIARLNFSHGDFDSHALIIDRVRIAARNTKKQVAILADLPGPKIRVGNISSEPALLVPGNVFILSTEDMEGNNERVSVTFSRLPEVVKPGDTLFLNDGMISLVVEGIDGPEVRTRVVVGGELYSRKGLNLPGIELGISAFTDHDLSCLKFSLERGVDAVSQSFVEKAEDVVAVREAAASMGHHPFIIAKIERAEAIRNLDEIMEVADGIMIARGDLGVEVPIEQIALVQKRVMKKAVNLCKPVITATQMLESMISNSRPTRAEATDVANAILDGTDCVMLSAESAAGNYPVESVKMLAAIARETEAEQRSDKVEEFLRAGNAKEKPGPVDIISWSVMLAAFRAKPAFIIVPTRSGYTARNIARFRLPVWLTALSSRYATCQALTFSYGVLPQYEPLHPKDWTEFARSWSSSRNLKGDMAILTEGPSKNHPGANHRMELIDLKKGDTS